MNQPKWHKTNILYCSSISSHRTHRGLIRGGNRRGWIINAIPWRDTLHGTYTGGLPIDGAISHLPPAGTELLNRQLGGAPHITLNAETAEALQMPCVQLDHPAAGRMAAEHFMKLGFTNLMAAVAEAPHCTFLQQLKGLKATACGAGLTSPIMMYLTEEEQSTYERSITAFGTGLIESPKPLAVMAANDRVGALLINACRQFDFLVPSQVAICGCGNDPVACDLASIPLSSVDTDTDRQALEAVELLERMIKGDPPPAPPLVIPPKELVVRKSSGIPAQHAVTTAKALAFMHEHAWDTQLNVPAIAEQTGVSQTTLFGAFRRELSMTPIQYLTRLRVNKALRLFRETDLKVKQVRPECGFSSDYQMYQAFMRTTGKSPGSHRKTDHQCETAKRGLGTPAT